MTRKIYGIFVAGGQGTRMGGDVPKQFLQLGGKPVLIQTIRKFLNACPSMSVVTVLPKEHFETWSELCISNGFDCPQKLVEGGITRFHSVKNALKVVPEGAIVMIHDGVRPLVSEGFIREMISHMEQCSALIPVLPCTDTLKFISKAADGSLCGIDAEDPDRSCIYGAQTPQMFHSELIKQAYSQGFSTSFTDDASVVKKMGKPLSYVLGERLNIKITTPQDLTLCEAIISCSNY